MCWGSQLGLVPDGGGTGTIALLLLLFYDRSKFEVMDRYENSWPKMHVIVWLVKKNSEIIQEICVLDGKTWHKYVFLPYCFCFTPHDAFLIFYYFVSK